MYKHRQELLDFSLQLANAATSQIMPHYLNCVVSTKPDGTEVTDADRRAEEAIREMIARQFPEDNVLGEEFGATHKAETKYQWVIDPLDGTTWFTLGVPIFGTLIALLEDGDPLLGVIHFPITGETVYAGKGLGCWFKAEDMDPVRIHVGAVTRLEDAVISAAGVHNSNVHNTNEQVPYNLKGVINQVKKFRFCGDCLQHALVCRGRVHAAIDTIMKPWDVAALIPCIEEAGGIATTLSGKRDGIVFGGSLLTSCDRSLHNQILDLLQPVAA